MFQFLTLGLCLYNQIAIELGRNIISRVSIDGMRSETKVHKNSALNFRSGLPNFSKLFSPSSIYNVSQFFEEGFNFEAQPFVVKKNKGFYLPSFESPVDKRSTLALYFSLLLEQNRNLKDGSQLTVSARDYYTVKQREELADVFHTAGFLSKTIPESLAACIFGAEYFSDENPVKRFYLNFRGNKVTGSLYEISKEKDITNIKFVEGFEFDLISDKGIEYLAAQNIIKNLGKEENTACIPYEELKDHTKFTFIYDPVTDFLNKLNSQVDELNILEVYTYLRDTEEKNTSYKDIKASLQEIRSVIIKDIETNMDKILEKIPENAEKFIITDISYRAKLFKDFEYSRPEAIVKGVSLSNNRRFKLEDEKIVSKVDFEITPMYSVIKHEVDLIREVAYELIPSIKESINKYEFLTEPEKESILALVATENYSFKHSSLIKNAWKQLSDLNIRREADTLCRSQDITELENALQDADECIPKAEGSVRNDFEKLYNETKNWYETSKDDKNATGFLNKAVRLASYTNYVNKMIAEKEKKIKEEANKVADEKNLDQKENEGAEDKTADKGQKQDAAVKDGVEGERIDEPMENTPENENFTNKTEDGTEEAIDSSVKDKQQPDDDEIVDSSATFKDFML